MQMAHSFDRMITTNKFANEPISTLKASPHISLATRCTWNKRKSSTSIMQSAHIHRLEAHVPTTQVLLSRYQITITAPSSDTSSPGCADCEKKLNFMPKIKKLLVGALKLSERRNYNSMSHNKLPTTL